MTTTIRNTLGVGIFYIALARYSNILISIFIGAILARLLTPSEFGIVGIVTVFVVFFNLLSDFGIGPAVVQNNSLSEEDIQSIFFLSILLGLLLSFLFFLAAPIIAIFYEKPELLNISKLLSLSVLFYSLQIVPKALCEKRLKFKQIGIVSITIQLLVGIIAILLAFHGYGYYALVIQNILAGGISLIIFYIISPIKFTLKFKITAIKKILRFSSFQFLFNFINYFSRNADNILIGKYFNSVALGYYDKSYRLMMMPVENLTHIITPVLMPVLSKYQEDNVRVYNVYLKIIKTLSTIGFSLSVFLYFTASEIIYIIYGTQWQESIPVFQLLALTVGLQMVLSSTGSIFQAINRTDLMFYGGIITAIFMLLGICYGVFIGKTLVSVGYGLIIAFSINFFIWLYLLIHKALRCSFLLFLKSFIYPFFISIGVGTCLFIESKFGITSIILSIMTKLLVTILSFGLFFVIAKENRALLKSEMGKYFQKR